MRHRTQTVILALTSVCLLLSSCATGKGAQEETSLPHALPLSGALNARELGGYPTEDGRTVREGLLLRSGELTGLTEEDAAALRDDFRLRVIVDLRQPDEASANPDPAVEGARRVELSVVPPPEEGAEDAAAAVKRPEKTASPGQTFESPYLNLALSMGDVREGLKGVYTGLVTEEASLAGFRQFFDLLLEEEEGAVLWHCTSGKDRTGVAAALVLSALGVDRETILEDFTLTNDYLGEKIERAVAEAARETDDPRLLEEVRILNGVDSSFLEAAFDAIEERCGSVPAFLENELGLSPERISALRERYLE